MSPRIYLSFDKYEDSEALDNALKADRLAAFINEFDQNVFRRFIKYDDMTIFEDTGEKLDGLDHDHMVVIMQKLRETYWRMYAEAVGEK